MTFHPLFNGRNVLLGVLQIITDIFGLATSHEAIFRWLARLGVDRPATVLNACCDMVRTTVGFCILKVKVLGASWGVIAKESVRSFSSPA